jgi:hypothetical protein
VDVFYQSPVLLVIEDYFIISYNSNQRHYELMPSMLQLEDWHLKFYAKNAMIQALLDAVTVRFGFSPLKHCAPDIFYRCQPN